uniref:Uncharacterized protein n=1 Tax=Micrurus lemniscatus lemniscatus TaxID=129467 RepID=A0A2D4HP28_MICLE
MGEEDAPVGFYTGHKLFKRKSIALWTLNPFSLTLETLCLVDWCDNKAKLQCGCRWPLKLCCILECSQSLFQQIYHFSSCDIAKCIENGRCLCCDVVTLLGLLSHCPPGSILTLFGISRREGRRHRGKMPPGFQDSLLAGPCN